jgi:hypothetical protein
VSHPSSRINYDLDPSRESFFTHIPKSYNGEVPYGLVVFVNADDAMESVPLGWESVLEQRKLLYVAPQKAGNDQPMQRRYGMAVLAAMKIMEQYRIDPRRVYVSGFSGGARVAGQLGFLQSDLFRGTIQNCGADFYEAVPEIAPRPTNRPSGAYGICAFAPEEIERAKQNVRFVLITGPKDFRHGDILDIYDGGYAKAGFQTRLIDDPGMGHAMASKAVLNQALDYLDQGIIGAPAAAPAPQPTQKTDWISKPPSAWPQIAMGNEAKLKPNLLVTGGMGFLLRLPNDTVVAATARHLIPDEISPAQLNSTLVSWTMIAPTTPPRSVILQKIAMRPSAASLDCLLLSLPRRTAWPVEPLRARQGPVGMGETVYLVGISGDGKSAQSVHKGIVKALTTEGTFIYDIGDVSTVGYSGAPIIDADGYVVGIHLGWIRFDDGVKRPHALGIPVVAEAADAPPPGAPMTATSDAAASGADVSQTTSEAATKAKTALQMARNYISVQNYHTARAKLNAIVGSYPNTPQAVEAAALLKQIEDKQ